MGLGWVANDEYPIYPGISLDIYIYFISNPSLQS